MKSWTSSFWLTAGLFGILGFLVYGASLQYGFLLWDDAFLIEHNALLKTISPTTIYQAFTTFDPELYIPLTFLSYQIDWMLGGGSPFAFHLTSLVLHIINALLVTRIVSSICANRNAGLAAGLIFLVHPVNTEAVVWASARKDLLSSMFFLLSFAFFLLYREQNNRRWYILSFSAFFLALLSKVTAMMLPAVLLLLDELQKQPRSLRRFREYIPFALLAVVFGVIAVLGKQQVLSTIPLWTLPFLTVRGIGLTLLHSILPLDLTILYPEDNPLNVINMASITGAVATAGLVGAMIGTWKRSPNIALGMGVFFLCMLPTFATFAKAGYVNIASDRYAYLPLLGLLITASALAEPWLKSKKPALTFGTITMIVVVLGVLAQRQAATWRDSRTLFAHALEIYPSAPVILTNLGVMAMNEKDFAEAERYFSAALESGTYANAAINLGKLRNLQGKPEEAAEQFRRASRMDPRDPESEFALGSLLADAGKDDEAMTAFREALHRNPLHSPSLNNLAALLTRNGRSEEAIPLFEQLLDTSPYYSDAWFNYALALQKNGRTGDAADAFLRALKGQPAQTVILETAVDLLLDEGRNSEAVESLRSALKANPNNSVNAQLALKTAKWILSADPENAQATELVRWMLQEGIVSSR